MAERDDERASEPETTDHESAAPDGLLSERAAILVSAVVGVVVTIGSLVAVNGINVFYETLPRISPTVEGGGVGADWVGGITRTDLKLLIEAIHVVDLLMGVFILVMVFIHWGAFRRLAARMRPPDAELATDGGDATRDAGDGGEGGDAP